MFLKSFIFSFLLFLYVGYSVVNRSISLINEFDFVELVRVIYSVTVSLLFLIRTKPAIVSMNPIHWAIALVTSFSAHFFIRESGTGNGVLADTAYILVIAAGILAFLTALTLGRSFGLFPALRKVKTKYVYQIVRHPMYLAFIIFKFGYVLKNPSIFNILLLAVVIILYDKRAKYEEDILSNDNSYVDYLHQVKYRFVPGIR